MGAAERVEPVMLGIAAKCLRVTPESIDPQAPLARYGLDSLSALELCVALSEATGLDVGEDDLLAAPSVHALAQRLGALADPCTQIDRRLERMLADARLPADIDPRAVLPLAGGGACLLTGASGFLGAHLLAALAAAGTSIIICPVRARDDRHALSRIEATLHRYGVVAPDMGSRVRAIAADLNDPQLGRWAADYDRLAREVGSVVHCAADVNWTLSYEGLRAANVLVTRNLLGFASRGARKRFHFVSSLAACYSTRARRAATELDAAPHPAGLHLGYAQSKWVAERLVEAAAERGLDATLYRPGLINAHSGSGIGNDDDLFAQLVRGVIALGHAPDLDWRLDACPVDYVAQAIARLAHVPNQGLAAVHLRNPRPARWSEAVLWMNVRGYKVSLEPFAAWTERAERASRDPGHALHRLRGFLFARAEGEGGRTLPEIYADPVVTRVDAQRSDALVAGVGLACPRLDARALERTLDAWVVHGVLPDVAGGRPRRRRRNASERADAQIEGQLQQHFADPCLRVIASRRRDFGADTSLLGELASWRGGAAVAMHARSVDVIAAGARPLTLDIVVKPKYADPVVRTVATRVAALCGTDLGVAFETHCAATGLVANAQRELAVYARARGALREILPRCYGVIDLEGVRALLLERVGGDAALEGGWSRATIDTSLAAMGRVHGEWLERGRAVKALLGGRFDAARAIEAQPLWRALGAFAHPRLRAWIGEEGARLQSDLARSAPAWLGAHARHPRTLIHNDLNPRNFLAGHKSFRAFDWELAEFGLPQRDAIEMLCFVIAPDASEHAIRRRIERHRAVTQSAAGVALKASQWNDGVRLALAEFGVRRLPMYLMADRFRPQGFLERVTRAWWRLAQVFALRRLPG